MTREVMKQALEALDNLLYWDNGKPEYDEARVAITALRQAFEKSTDPIVGTKTWFDGDKVVTQELKHSDVYEQPSFTTGHCKEHAKPGGCQLHNLHCGYPQCDRKPVDKQPAADRATELLKRCENEMRYAGWDKFETDNTARNGVYEQVKQYLEKNT